MMKRPWALKIAVVVGVAVLISMAYCHGRNSVDTGDIVGQDVLYTQIEEQFDENYKPPEAGMEDDYINHLIDSLHRSNGLCTQP